MSDKLNKLTIRGFKSIETLVNFKLDDLNILIGANGSGKSNFVSFFRVLRAMADQSFQAFILKRAPADGYFYNGVSFTKSIQVDLSFGVNRYAFTLEPTDDGRIMIAREEIEYTEAGSTKIICNGELEAQIKNRKDDRGVYASRGPAWYVFQSISSWQVYHFHDTSMNAGMRREVGIDQSDRLSSDASNLAAFLLKLKSDSPNTYELIRKTVRRIAPYFDDFDFRITEDDIEDTVRLTWRQKNKDYIFSPGHFSDGTIRFICLATVLLQPEPPRTIVLDEPELGLHPEAISLLGGLLRSASSRIQIIVATQSPALLSEFDANQIITTDQINGRTQLERLSKEDLELWLDTYSLGDLWQKGNIKGGINHD